MDEFVPCSLHERADRECGEHRPGLDRSWCFEDREWCYPGEPCRGCELPTLRAELDEVRAKARFAIDEAIKLGEAQLVVIDQRDQAKAEVERLREHIQTLERTVDMCRSLAKTAMRLRS